MAHAPITLAVLLSGGGTTMQNLAHRIHDGKLHASIGIVIASNPRAAGVEKARALSLPCEIVPRSEFDSRESYSKAIFDLVRRARADYVCLAGFLSLLDIPDDFAHRVINIHPALLPSFGGPGMYGRHVHQAVLNHGCKVSGCTVHFADQTYDTGPIILQRCCAVHEGDTPDSLAERVMSVEREAYPDALQLIAQGRVSIDGKRTRIADAPRQ